MRSFAKLMGVSHTIYLLRHGETVWNRSGRLQGQLDAPLTEQGTRQAVAMGKTLKEILGQGAFHFLASPLGRTRQSAALIAEQLGYDYDSITWDERLKEITLGDHDGYPGWAQLNKDHPELAKLREADPWNFQHPNGESSQMVQDRVRPLLAEMTQREGVLVVVAHGVVNKILRGLYLGLTQQQTFALDRPQDAFFRLEGGTEARIEIEF